MLSAAMVRTSGDARGSAGAIDLLPNAVLSEVKDFPSDGTAMASSVQHVQSVPRRDIDRIRMKEN